LRLLQRLKFRRTGIPIRLISWPRFSQAKIKQACGARFAAELAFGGEAREN